MIQITRPQYWLTFGFILIVLPASLLAVMSWKFLTHLEDNLHGNREREIVSRANALQDFEAQLIEKCQALLTVTAQGKPAGSKSSIQILIKDFVVCDFDFNLLNDYQKPLWERNSGRELDALASVPPHNPQLVNTLRRIGYLEDPEQEITRRLLLARSLRARGLGEEARQEFFNLSQNYPNRDEAVWALLACCELDFQYLRWQPFEASLRALQEQVNLFERSESLKRLVLRSLSKVQPEQSHLREIIQEIAAGLQESLSKQSPHRDLFIERFHSARLELKEAWKSKRQLLRHGSMLWMIAQDSRENRVVLGVLNLEQWIAQLKRHWSGQKGTFSLEIDFLKDVSRIGFDKKKYQVHLNLPGVGAEVYVSATDNVTQLFNQQVRLGTWGTGLLVLILLFGAVMAVTAARQAQKVSRLKSDFVSTVSHELRTPLTSIQMFIETLRAGRVADEKERHKSYEIIERETKRLKGLIERLLAFSAMEKESNPLKREPVALDRVCRHCVEIVKPQFDEVGMSLMADIPEEEVEIYGDGNILVEIILNLLSNAQKYGREGKIVELSLQVHDRDCVLCVSDRGPGIQLEKQNVVFEAFVRERARSSEQVEGVGLGLALVQRWVQWHQGSVRVENRSGGGTVFEVRLPRGSSHLPKV